MADGKKKPSAKAANQPLKRNSKPAAKKTATIESAATAAAPQGAATVTAAEPELIATDKIRRNPKNPRLTFAEGPLERLADSIEETGVLVPLTVYRDAAEKDGTEYVLLDGERRLRAAKLTNAPNVPAWVVAKPNDEDNALRMFNIHMLREPWGDIATTWAFRDLKKETGVTDDRKLQRMTGLTIDSIKNMNRVLSFPEEWQQMVFDGKLPFNLLVELDKAVLSKAKSATKGAPLQGRSVEDLREIFLNKYVEGTFRDVVDLRKVGALLETATKDGKIGSRAQKALGELLDEPSMSISEAFDVGAAASLDLSRVLNDMSNLPERLEDLASAPIDLSEKTDLAKAVDQLVGRLQTIAASLATP